MDDLQPLKPYLSFFLQHLGNYGGAFRSSRAVNSWRVCTMRHCHRSLRGSGGDRACTNRSRGDTITAGRGEPPSLAELLADRRAVKLGVEVPVFVPLAPDKSSPGAAAHQWVLSRCLFKESSNVLRGFEICLFIQHSVDSNLIENF